MNTLLQIKFKDDLYCFSNLLNQETCQICTVVIEFVRFEDESAKKMMTIDFFKKCQSRLYTCAECFILIHRPSVAFWMLNTFTLSKNDPEE